MEKMARWGKQYFAYELSRMLPVMDHSKEKSYNADEKEKEPVSCTLTCKLVRDFMKEPVWSEVDLWKKRLGKLEYLYIGETKVAKKKMRLMKVNVSDVILGKMGDALVLTLSLDFEEFHRVKKETINGATGGGGSVTYSKGGLYSGSYGGGKFSWPVPGHTRISSNYGWRNCPFHGKEKHTGIDIPAPYGVSVRAAADGRVHFSGYLGSFGNAVIISHGSSLFTLYAHNSRLVAGKGRMVKRGQEIAKIGKTGTSTGYHSHFEVRKGSGEYGSDVNPWSYVRRP